MKTLNLWVTGIFILFSVAVGYSETNFWERVNGPFGGGVSAISKDYGGDIYTLIGRTILKSTDSGISWIKKTKPALGYPHSILRDSNGDLYAASMLGLSKSRDDGETWNYIDFGFGHQDIWIKSFFICSNGNFLASIFSENHGIYLSSNRGLTWIKTDTTIIPYSFIELSNNQLFCRTLEQGVYYSSDGGYNWIRRGFENRYIYHLIRTNDDHLLVFSTSDTIFISTDQGFNWTPIGVVPYFPSSVALSQDGKIYIATDNGIYRSANNGINWESIGLQNVDCSKICITNNGTSIVGTYVFGIYCSTNGGITWTNDGIRLKVNGLAENGIGVLFAGTESYGVFRSSDFGNNWVSTNIFDVQITSIGINTSGDIFTTTLGRGLQKSMDNGANWHRVNVSPNLNHFYSLLIDSNDEMYIGGNNGMIFYSPDGYSWFNKSLPVSYGTVNKICINSNGDVLVSVYDVGIFRSTDQGVNWINITENLETTYIKSFEVNSNNHIFVGTGEGIYRSTDNGNSWLLHRLIDRDITSIVINSKGHIYVGINLNELYGVYLSINNGISWGPVIDGLVEDIVTNLYLSADEYVFVMTEEEGVFRSRQKTTSIKDINEEVPTSFLLEQNYPNPFNPATTINYCLPYRCNVKLEIFNALGQIVTELVNNEISAGYHTIEWSSNVGSGIYFYRIQAVPIDNPVNSYVDVKKMLLIK